MSSLRNFEAPWGRLLRLVTVLATAVLLGQVVLGLALPKLPTLVRILLIVVPVVGILAGGLFAVRGYELTTDGLLVLRPLWKTRISLVGLQAVTADPQATRRSVRTCGNGGFFAFTGWYWNKTLGKYRMFATDLRRAVILAFERQKVVVTPEDPEVFVRCLKEHARLK